jgi:hypothetical protein
MNPSKLAVKVSWALAVAALFFLSAGFSAAQEPGGRMGVFAWSRGKAVDGLEMTLSLDQANRRSNVPTFKIELRNAGKTDLLLNLGTMASDGARQLPSSISLILVDPQGKPQRLELRNPGAASSAGKRSLSRTPSCWRDLFPSS